MHDQVLEQLGACEPPECYPDVSPQTWQKEGPYPWGYGPGSAGGDIGKPKGTTPGAVAVVASAWNFDSKPYATYTLQWGDTLTGLALTYLGSGAWQPIWSVQDGSYKAKRTPDKIYVGDVINMPAEAAARAKKLIKGEDPNAPDRLPWWAWVIGGSVAAAAAYAVYAYAAPKMRRHLKKG